MKNDLILNTIKTNMNFKKANVIVITLFVTILVWIMWLITTKYVMNLLKVSSENHKYYKAYYIAYGGLELELLKWKNHWYGFEDTVLSGSNTVSKNFTGVNYYFSSKILSNSNYITNTYKTLLDTSINCSDSKNWIKLATWDGLMVPLFYDKNTQEATISWINYDTTDISNTVLYYSWYIVTSYNRKIELQWTTNDVMWAWKKFSKIWNWNVNINSELGSLALDVNTFPFLVIWWVEKSSICLENFPNKLVTPHTYISSEWNYMDRKVTVKVVKENKWAQFSIYWMY